MSKLEMFIGSFFGVVPTNMATDADRFVARATSGGSHAVPPERAKAAALAIACPACDAAAGAHCTTEVLHTARFAEAFRVSPWL